MKKISEQAADAFNSGNRFNKSNTEVMANPSEIYLHGKLIAQKTGNTVKITNAGWFSNVTKDRLNALSNVSIHQSKGVWYLNGTAWDGKWIEI